MRRLTCSITAFVCIVLAGSVSAAHYPIGYIGVFKDATHDIYQTLTPVCPDVFGTFDAWIWCLPGENGLQAADFAVGIPATTAIVGSLQNPIITIAIGRLPEGISIAFSEGMCQTDWVWTHRLTLMLLEHAAGTIEIMPNPDIKPNPAYQFASCLLGYPTEPCIRLASLYVCYSIGVERTNWGAIKRLF
jgi:hypothetical protein